MSVLKHFKTISKHKFLVMKYCFRVGLYKQGLLHDLSKYSYTEFHIGAKYYQGTRSPNNAEREDTGYSSAWLHHKGRNKHHYEYWMDFGNTIEEGIVGAKMPTKYVAEMFLDRVAASKNYEGSGYTTSSPLTYYNKSKDYIIIHPETRKTLEFLLNKLITDGEDSTLNYIKNDLLKHR